MAMTGRWSAGLNDTFRMWIVKKEDFKHRMQQHLMRAQQETGNNSSNHLVEMFLRLVLTIIVAIRLTTVTHNQ